MIWKCAVLAAASALAFGQTDTRPRFEVASVKVSEATSRIGSSFPPGRAVLTHIRLKDVIPLAYGLQPFLVSGGPDWFGTDHYDIVGSLPSQEGTPPTRQQALAALQVLLEERFHLGIHRETKTLPLYKLTIAKGGFKPKEGEELPDGTQGGGIGSTASRFVSKKWPLSSLVAMLAGNLGCQVEDHTGLQGLYSFVLEWHFDRQGSDEFEANMIAALRLQLGLNLEPGKGPVQVLVIDSAQRPAAN